MTVVRQTPSNQDLPTNIDWLCAITEECVALCTQQLVHLKQRAKELEAGRLLAAGTEAGKACRAMDSKLHMPLMKELSLNYSST